MSYLLDYREFWEENEKCFEPFTTKKPRVPVKLPFDDHFLLEEMEVESTLRYYKDRDYRLKMNKLCNDRMEKAIGMRHFDEKEDMTVSPNRFEVIMGAYWAYSEGGTPWLESNVKEIDDVKEIIRKAEKIDMRKAAFPEEWYAEKERVEKTTGVKLDYGSRGHRGPATMATSILGTENTCIFIMDEPDVMKAFYEVLTQKMVEYHNALLEATNSTLKPGYWITDDNSYLFPPQKYEEFCAPFLERMFSEFAPRSEDYRYQHSDSAMGHLMPILHNLGVNNVNFGPTIHPSEIRKAMPKAVIQGQMPPFTLRNGTPDEIIEIVKRDIDAVGADGGLVATTAGSIAAGTPLENIQVYLWAVNEYGRYS
jgi:uroporphyrinogen decarboxylase